MTFYCLKHIVPGEIVVYIQASSNVYSFSSERRVDVQLIKEGVIAFGMFSGSIRSVTTDVFALPDDKRRAFAQSRLARLRSLVVCVVGFISTEVEKKTLRR